MVKGIMDSDKMYTRL